MTDLPVRDMGFAFPESVPLVWNRTIPELAVSANSISLLMPYVEPFIARTMRAAMDGLDEPLRARTGAFVRQELAHHAEHRRFNDGLAAECPGLRRVERRARQLFAWMQEKRSLRWRVAFSASSETIAFGIARWAEKNMDRVFFRGADPEAVRLFLWHLAEEVEHKTAAYDVFEATDGSRRRYAGTALFTVVLLVAFVTAGNLVQLWSLRRLRLPVTWFRLARWSVSLAFTLLPLVAGACFRGHHPSHLTDPAYLTQWLRSPASRRPHDGGDGGRQVAEGHGEHERVGGPVEVAQVQPAAADGQGDGREGEPGP